MAALRLSAGAGGAVMSTQLYALIRKTSEHAHQQPRDENGKAMHFEVTVDDGRDAYRVHADFNRYRLSDVNFFVKAGDAFVRLS